MCKLLLKRTKMNKEWSCLAACGWGASSHNRIRFKPFSVTYCGWDKDRVRVKWHNVGGYCVCLLFSYMMGDLIGSLTETRGRASQAARHTISAEYMDNLLVHLWTSGQNHSGPRCDICVKNGISNLPVSRRLLHSIIRGRAHKGDKTKWADPLPEKLSTLPILLGRVVQTPVS